MSCMRVSRTVRRPRWREVGASGWTGNARMMRVRIVSRLPSSQRGASSRCLTAPTAPVCLGPGRDGTGVRTRVAVGRISRRASSWSRRRVVGRAPAAGRCRCSARPSGPLIPPDRRGRFPRAGCRYGGAASPRIRASTRQGPGASGSAGHPVPRLTPCSKPASEAWEGRAIRWYSASARESASVGTWPCRRTAARSRRNGRTRSARCSGRRSRPTRRPSHRSCSSCTPTIA